MMIKTKKLAFYAAIALCIALLFSIAFKAFETKAEAANADKIQTDFKQGSEGWNLNDFAATSDSGLTLIPSATATTVDSMGDLLMFITVGDISSGFDIKFGVKETGSACSLSFENKVLSAEGLKDSSGKSSVLLPAPLKAGSIVKVEMIGGYVEISMKNADEPFDFLGSPAATLFFEQGVSSEGNISLSVSEGASVTISDIAIYSLGGKVNIDTENFVPPAPEPTPEIDKNNNNLAVILMATLIPLGVILIGGAAFIIIRKRRNANEKNS